MKHFLKHPRPVLFLGALGLIGFGLVSISGGPEVVRAQTKAAKNPFAKNGILPPPEDVNELSMEVAALRMLYLLKAGPLQLQRAREQRRYAAKNDAETGEVKPRKRQEADVSPEYRQVLTELREAFIKGQEDRINELSEQLDDLTKEEDPDLDDGIEITQGARQHASPLLSYFDGGMIVKYLAAYGKDLPSPRNLLYQTIRLDGKGKKPTPEQWKEIQASVSREVSWLLGGVDLEKEKTQKIREKVVDFLDRAYALSDEELKKQKKRLIIGINRIAYLDPTEIIKHVIELDLAELLSNPRLKPAVEARLKYLNSLEKSGS